MPKTIVLNEHTLGVVYPAGLQVLRASIIRGAPWRYEPGIIPFDPVLMAGQFRPATEQDFDDFNVSFHPDYLKED